MFWVFASCHTVSLLVPSVLPNKQQIAAGGGGGGSWLFFSGKQSEMLPSDGAATLTKPEMRASSWPGEVNVFPLCIPHVSS